MMNRLNAPFGCGVAGLPATLHQSLLELLLDSTTWLEVLANANYAATYQVYLLENSYVDSSRNTQEMIGTGVRVGA